MRNSLTLHITLLLLAFCAINPPAWTHDALDENIPEDFIPAPAVSGAAQFAGMLEQHARSLLSGEELRDIARVNRLLREAHALGQAEPGSERSEVLRSFAEHRLLHLVEDIKPRLDTEVRSGTAHADYRRFAPLSGDTGLVLLRVRAAGEGLQYSTTQFDMNNFDATWHGADVFCGPGTSWVLALVGRAPAGRSMHPLNFRFAWPGPVIRGKLPIDAPPVGRLKVAILDENGDPVPALVRLVSGDTGRLHRPGGALDYTDQMDMPALFDRGTETYHWTNVPGPFGGLYWCVPEPFDMGISAGNWELVVRRGIEHLPLQRAFSVAEGTTTSLTVRLERWTNMAERGWYSGDGHVHSRILSNADADRMLAWAEAEGINVVNVLKMGDHLRTYFEQRGLGPEFRVRRGDHVLVPGQEDPRFVMGHAIGLNLQGIVRDVSKYALNDWVADEIHAQGGLYGFAHLATSLFDVQRDMTMLIPRGKADFGEILQFRTLGTQLYYDFLDLGFPLAASAGSDVPYGSALGEVRMYAYQGPGPFDPDLWFNAVQRGRTFVTNGPMVDLRVEDAFPGDTVTVAEDRTLRVTVRAWGAPGTSAPQRVNVVRHGQVVAELMNTDGDNELILHTETEVGYGFWIAAHVMGMDGSEAHSTPVYVVREGFRFWNTDRVPELLAARAATLDELEALFENARDCMARGTVPPTDIANTIMAEQAAMVLERIELVRGIMRGLDATYERELAVRSPDAQ